MKGRKKRRKEGKKEGGKGGIKEGRKCPSWRNRCETDTRKTDKYRTARRELIGRNECFRVQQTNIFVDVMGGYIQY